MIKELHPNNYNGYPFITLIQFHDQHIITIIDNVDKKTLKAYVLDLCEAEGVNESAVIQVASEWYSTAMDYPVSIEFSKRGMTNDVSRIYRTYPIENIIRVIGPLKTFDMDHILKIRRRRRIAPPNVVIPTLNIV